MMGPAFMVGIALYVFGFVFFTYYCVFADPNTSSIAAFLTVTLPEKIWSQLERVLGPRSIKTLSILADRFLMISYLFLVLGSWSIVFWFVYPWINESTYVSNYHKYTGYLVFFCCMGSWRLCSISSPGLITPKSLKRFDHYPYDNVLFAPDRTCPTVGIPRLPRSKFDRLKYNQHVARYDHFCGWVYNTIGEENHRWFMLFLLVHIVMCAYGTSVCSLLFWGEIKEKKLLELTFFDLKTGEEFKATPTIVFQYLLNRRMPEASVFLLMAAMAIALALFFLYHAYLTSFNMTTNESEKWGILKKWHKSETKRYKEAMAKQTKRNLVKQGNAEMPEVADGDVTCTPTANRETNNVPSPAEDIRDPGPFPKNIYDRGFVENWKELLFPISLRKETLDEFARSQSTQAPNGDVAIPGKSKAT